MINLIKEQLMIRKLKKSIRAYTRPDQWFLTSSRLKFVTLAQQRAGARIETNHSRSWRYATVAILAIISIVGGMAGFADANNVPVTNPLYNFKRISEQARLSLSSTTQQVELHQVFARRRLKEVIELEVELETEKIKEEVKIEVENNLPIPVQSQERINKLNRDFEDEAEAGLAKAQNPKIKKEVRQKFCQDILDTINSRADKRQNPSIERVKVKCIEEENKIEEEDKDEEDRIEEEDSKDKQENQERQEN